MRVLIADDEPVSRRALEGLLAHWGHEIKSCSDGLAAWYALAAPDAPGVAILDWLMPGLDGVEICKRLRDANRPVSPYVILLTGRSATVDAIDALEGGADAYLAKPCKPELLHAHITAGARIVELRAKLADRVRELEGALAQVKQLRGLLPICCYCKNVRVGDQYWRQIEAYVADHSDAEFSHAICPDCFAKHCKAP